MLIRSQPIDPKFCGKFNISDTDEPKAEPAISNQRVGKMFDDLIDNKKRPGLLIHLKWKKTGVVDKYKNIKHTVRNHFKWHKTMSKLRSWEGFDGLLTVMQTHLKDYVETEEKYGISLEEYKQHKITTAKETIEILERMSEPDEYSFKRREDVDIRYPKYSYLISEYKAGGRCYSGNFVPQGQGWAGKESGTAPREGYFEFVDGRFESVESPDDAETNRILSELARHNDEVSEAYRQAEADSDRDFDRLGKLLKENLYSWWD